MHDDAWKCTALAVWYNGYLYPEILGTMAEGLTGWKDGRSGNSPQNSIFKDLFNEADKSDISDLNSLDYWL